MRFGIAMLFASALSFGLAAPGAAQDNDIVVTAERLHQQAVAYTAEVAQAPRSADQYARWDTRLCPRVAGIDPSAAQSLIDHIARRAYQVGVQAEREGCQANLIIVFASEPQQFARQVVDSRRDLMGYYSEDDVTTEGRDALSDFVHSTRPVRWWHVSRTTTADGRQLGNTSTRGGRGTSDARPVVSDNGSPSLADNLIPNNQSGGPNDMSVALIGNGLSGTDGVRSNGTRTRQSTRQDISFALVIVDANAAAELPPEAVADYLAMATLVQVNPDADMSAFPSVLNLFSHTAAAPDGMTAWDQAYLQGLYTATREASNSRRQRADIARRMAESVRVTPQVSN